MVKQQYSALSHAIPIACDRCNGYKKTPRIFNDHNEIYIMQQALNLSTRATPLRTVTHTTPVNDAIYGINQLSVSSVNLSFNFLGKRIAAVIAQASIPNSANHLDLSWNHLDRLTGIELAVIFNSLPVTLQHLTIAGNDFNNLSVLHLQAMNGCLPFIKQLSLSTQEMTAMSQEQLHALAKIAPNARLVASGQAYSL